MVKLTDTQVQLVIQKLRESGYKESLYNLIHTVGDAQ